MKELIKNLDRLANSLGFGKVKSYAVLYGTTINTYGRKDASMWFFTISLNDDHLICGIEVHTTYFSKTPQVNNINAVASFDNPITFEEAFKLT